MSQRMTRHSATRTVVPSNHAAAKTGETGRADNVSGSASSTSPSPQVSEQFSLPRLLEGGQAVEIIPGVLYFASIAERPPPASAFVPPSAAAASRGAAATPQARRSSVDAAGDEPLLGARSSAVVAVGPGTDANSQSVGLPLVLQPLQLFGTAAHTGNGSSQGPTGRRESLLSLTDLPAGPSASAVSVPPASFAASKTSAAPQSASFSLKAYLKSHYPAVAYPPRAASATAAHSQPGQSTVLAVGAGGGLLKSTLPRPQSRATSAGAHRALLGSASSHGALRRRVDRSVSISVVPPTHVTDQEPLARVSGTATSDKTVREMENSSSGSSSDASVSLPSAICQLYDALVSANDGGNGGACVFSPHDGAFYTSIFGDPTFEYRSFFADFGPLDLGCVVRFSRRLAALLSLSAGYEWHDTDKTGSEMTMGSAAAAAAAAARKRRALSVLEPPTDIGTRLPDVVPIVVCTGLEAHERANVACLLGCFCVSALRWSASAVQPRLQRIYPPLLAFRDASSGASSYPLSVMDVVRGMRKASQLAWVDVQKFDLEAYDTAKRYDYSWIVPHKVLALSSPEDDKPSRTAEVYARLLGSMGVSMIVRLNDALYDASVFRRSGIKHVELEFPDGTAPNDADLKCFLSAVEEEFGEATATSTAPALFATTAATNTATTTTTNGRTSEAGGTYRGLPPATTRIPIPPGKRHATTTATDTAASGRRPHTAASTRSGSAGGTRKSNNNNNTRAPSAAKRRASQHGGVVAVHCRAGLGRTGTVIAVYMMRHYGFTARESISWIRLCRPGSITGIQQQYLEAIERRLTPPARVWTDLQWAASAAGSVGLGGGRIDTMQPAYQSHGAVAMDPSRQGAGSGAGAGQSPTASSSSGLTTSAAATAGTVCDVFGVSMNSDAPPQFTASLQSAGHGMAARRSTVNIFHTGLTRALQTAGDGSAVALTSRGGTSGGGEGAEASLSGLFLRRGTPTHNGTDVLTGPNGALGGGGSSSRPGTGLSGLGGGGGGVDAVAAEQRYELAEVEALLCDPSFVPHRSILDRLKYPSSYFLALEQANPFGTAVALQREFASRRRQQPAATRAVVEKISASPSKAASAAKAAAAGAGATAAGGAETGNVTFASSLAGRRPVSRSGSGGATTTTSTTAATNTNTATLHPHTHLVADAAKERQPTPTPTPPRRPSLKLDTSAMMQAAVARSNAALTSRGGIASRYQAIRTREVHAMMDVAAPITVPSRIRLNSIPLNSSLALGGGSGGAGGGSHHYGVSTGTNVGGGGSSSSGPTGLSFREGVHATRRASVSLGDTSFPSPPPQPGLSSLQGTNSLGECALDGSLVLTSASPLQPLNMSARNLQSPQSGPVSASSPATALATPGSQPLSGTGAGTVGGSFARFASTAAVTPLRTTSSAASPHTVDVSGSGAAGGGGPLSSSNTTNTTANRSAVYVSPLRAASVAALQPTLIAAANTGAGVSSSNLLLPSMSVSTVGGLFAASHVTQQQQQQHRAAKLGWGAREVRVAR